MQQILIRIPGINLPIFGFGAMLFIAFLICTWVAGRRARREGIAPVLIQDVAIWLFAGGILGARTLYLLKEAPPANVLDFFWQLPRIWDGGIILYGAIAGGIVGYIAFYWLSFRRHGIPTLQLADVLAPSIALGIGIGRLGCFLNGCCYGQVACAACALYPVHFPLSAPPRYELVHAGYQPAAGFTYADDDQPEKYVRVGRVEPGSAADQAGLKDNDLISIANGEALAGGPGTPAQRLSDVLGKHWVRGQNELRLIVFNPETRASREVGFTPRTIGLLPTQLYETVSMFLLFLVLTALYPVRHRQGLVTAVLMMGYAAHRALNELLRNDPRPIGLESYTSYFLFGAGLLLAVFVLSRGRKVNGTAAVPAPEREAIGAAASALV